MRYWIFDTDGTPQNFPLQRLVRRVIGALGGSIPAVEIVRARGYGLRVTQLENRTEAESKVVLEIGELEALAAGTEEWFYDVEVHIPGTSITFGLHDSTALFVEGEDSVVASIASEFSDTRPAQAPS